MESRQNVIVDKLCFYVKTQSKKKNDFRNISKSFINSSFDSRRIVLILGIGTLFKGGETSKKYSNKLMQLRVILQFIAIIALVGFAYFFKN